MAEESPTLSDFVELGEALVHIRNPQVADINSYTSGIKSFLQLLLRCNLTRTQKAATPIDGAVLHYFPRTGGITPNHRAQLQTLARSIASVLYDEVMSKSVIITDAQDIPKSLFELHTRLGVANLEPHQEALRNDVVTCLKVRAYRPAIVVAWALGFDLVRWWVYSDVTRMADFNQLLGQRTQRAGGRQVVNYQDFFSEKEAFILEILRDANGSLQCFTGKTHRLLENLLDDRNAFAHANFADATESESKSYIERLLRVLTTAPFT